MQFVKCILALSKIAQFTMYISPVNAQAHTHFQFNVQNFIECTKHTFSAKLQSFSNKSQLYLLKGWLPEILTNSSTNQNSCIGHTIHTFAMLAGWFSNECAYTCRHHRCGWYAVENRLNCDLLRRNDRIQVQQLGIAIKPNKIKKLFLLSYFAY